MKVIFAVKTGDPDYLEQLLTDSQDPSVQEKAIAWAKQNGFNRFRVAIIDLTSPLSFPDTLSKNK